MNEKVKCFLRGLGIILGQFLLTLFILLLGVWLFGTLIITWAMSRA